MTGLITAERDQALFDAIAVEPMLDEVIVDVWEGLAVDRVVECPVCAGRMGPVHDAQGPENDAQGAMHGGRCTDCGSTLR